MDLKHHTHPDNLERYSFLWSEARLVIAAGALFLGGVPPFLRYAPPAFYGLMGVLNTLAYLISGAAAVYLLVRWNPHRKVFGGSQRYDAGAFFVLVASGVNLGIVGLMGTNIGMSISRNYTLFVIVGILYLASAYHLWKRWNAHGQKLF